MADLKNETKKKQEAVRAADDGATPNVADEGNEVGYARPPKHTRFPKGVSGNPGGRKPGVKNFATFVKQALDQTVTVKSDGRNRRMSVRQAIAHRLVATCAANDLKALGMLMPLMQQLDAASEQQVERSHTVDDEAVLKRLRDHLRGREDDDAQS